MKKKRPVLGLSEEVKIYLPNGKFIRRKAKVDTGARSTAIDISIAKKIGTYHIYQQFNELMPKLRITKQNYKEVKVLVNSQIKPRLKRQIPGLRDIQVIQATNGITVRPYVDFEYKLKGKRIKTVANIVDRKVLIYPILIGQVDMGGFLIDPMKNVYRSI